MLTDTHCHLDFPDFQNDLDAVVERAAESEVRRIIAIGTTIEGSKRCIELAEKYPNVFATVGVHPGNALEAPEDVTAPLRELARHPKVVAIGECGLDYYRLPSEVESQDALEALATSQEDPLAAIQSGAIKTAQAAIFSQQLELAAELGMNVVIHQRNSWLDTVAAIEPYTGKLKCVFHCFGGSPDQADEILNMGHLVSFTGIVTFKNATEVKETAMHVPLDRFMVETDAPYLAPVPYRGKRAEPTHARTVAEVIAKLRGVTLEQIAEVTEATANGFFRFG